MLNKNEQNIFYQKLGERIKSLRKQVGMKQEVLAQRLGLTRISVSNIEMGKQKVQLHVLIEIADAFNVSISDIVPGLETLVNTKENIKLQKDIKKEMEKFDVPEGATDLVAGFVKLSKTKL